MDMFIFPCSHMTSSLDRSCRRPGVTQTQKKQSPKHIQTDLSREIRHDVAQSCFLLQLQKLSVVHAVQEIKEMERSAG